MGKMGKPQKSKKHRKLKTVIDSENPIGQVRNKKRLQNLRPQNEDHQEMPKKVRDIMRLKKDGKGRIIKQNRAQDSFKMVRGMSKPLKAAPVFVKGKEESQKAFMRRVDVETSSVLTKSRIEEKYQVQFEDGDGDEPVVKKEKSDRKKEKEREKKKKKKEGKMNKQLDRKGDFGDFTDHVQFGETVMQPPLLTALPRKAKQDDTTAKPGKRSLLLKQVMQDGSSQLNRSKVTSQDQSNRSKVASLASRHAGQTVKRKLLSPAQQQISDFQRTKAIELYRQMKQQKMTPS